MSLEDPTIIIKCSYECFHDILFLGQPPYKRPKIDLYITTNVTELNKHIVMTNDTACSMLFCSDCLLSNMYLTFDKQIIS